MSERDRHAALLRDLLEGRFALDETAPAWAHVFVACATGRFTEAHALGIRLFERATPLAEGQLRLTSGSALRQEGRYAAARTIERDDFALDPFHRVHLSVSRAANFVGEADPDRARLEIEAAAARSRTLPAPADDFETIELRRVHIRSGWVATEIELSAAAPADALTEIERVAATPGLAEWPRHEAKTRLFRGVVLRELGRLEEAVEDLRAAERIATGIGAIPVAEVSSRLTRECGP